MKRIHFQREVRLLSWILIASMFLCSPILADDTSDQLNQANSDLERLRQEQASLSTEISDLSNQLAAQGEKISSIDSQISDKQKEISSLNLLLSEINSEKDERYTSMKLRIKYIYESGNSSAMSLLLTSGSLSELFTRTEYIQQISMYDRRMLGELEDLFRKEKESNDRLTADLSQLDILKEEAAWQQQTLQNLISDKRSQFSASDELISETEALALQYEAILESQKDDSDDNYQQVSEDLSEVPSSDVSPEESADEPANDTPDNSTESSGSIINPTDLAMMAAIIECEAGNQPYEGLIAVGSVVMNRINSPRWPNTLTAVLYQSGQFTPVASGRFAIVLARGATDRCQQAAAEVLSGVTNVSYMFFHTNRPSDAEKSGIIIGDHFFY